MSKQKTVDLSFSMAEDGYDFAGIEELNDDLANGWSVIAAGPGELVLVPTGETTEAGERYTASGWRIPLTLSKSE